MLKGKNIGSFNHVSGFDRDGLVGNISPGSSIDKFLSFFLRERAYLIFLDKFSLVEGIGSRPIFND